jgi:Fe-S cluster assembly protein SufD
MHHQYTITKNQQQEHLFIFDKKSTDFNIDLSFYLEEDAQLILKIYIFHVSITVKIQFILAGKGAHAHIQGAYVLSGKDHVNINTLQHHRVEHTTSLLNIKGVLKDSSYAHYQGTIRIEKGANHASASQENKNMLLSSSARAVSVPQLEVLAHNVRCFHGSAVGRFDEQHLFYAACRGISEEIAEKILLAAFLSDVLDRDSSVLVAGM